MTVSVTFSVRVNGTCGYLCSAIRIGMPAGYVPVCSGPPPVGKRTTVSAYLIDDDPNPAKLVLADILGSAASPSLPADQSPTENVRSTPLRWNSRLLAAVATPSCFPRTSFLVENVSLKPSLTA